MNRKIHALCIAALAVTLAVWAADARGALTVTTHASQASFNAAAGATTLEDFNAAPVGAFTVLPLTDFTISESVALLSLAILPGSHGANFDGSTFLQYANQGGFEEGMDFNFAQPINAVGFPFKNQDSSFDVIGLRIDGQDFAIGGPGTSGFFGITTDGPFTFFQIIAQTGGDLEPGSYYDDFQYAFASGPIPEPASLGLVGLGLVALLRRKRGCGG